MRPRSSSLVAGVGCLLAASCGGRALAPAGAIFVDGTRLKAIWEQAPGGPKRQVGWYDTVLGTPCVFSFTAGLANNHPPTDKQYCIPTPATGVALDASTVFADPSCTQPAVGVDCEQRFAIAGPQNYQSCDGTARVFEIAGPVSPKGFHAGSPGGCYAAGQPPTDGVEWHALGAEIPLASLVSATVEIPSGDGPRIRPARMVADDGASQPVFAWDSARREPVELPAWWYPDAPVSKWRPMASAVRTSAGTYFNGADCSQWVATTQTCGGASVRSVAEYAASTCGGVPSQYYEVGTQVDPSAVYDSRDGSCAKANGELLATSDGFSFFAPGAPIPDDAFADARVIDQGTSHILLRQPGSADGPVDIGSGRFVDSRYQQFCEARTAADGSLRCLPTAGSWLTDLYADASCTIPVASDNAVLDGCPVRADPSVVSMLQPRENWCGRSDRYRTYQVAGPHVGALYYLFNGVCSDWSSVAGTFPVFDLGAELPPESFEPIATSEHYPAW